MSTRQKKSLAPQEMIKSFGHAFDGVKDIVRTEHNAWIHSVMTVIVLLISWWVGLDFVRWCFIILAIVSVWVAESFNTAVEILTDHVSPDYSPTAKRAKDIAAAAVLIACIGAFVLGMIILVPAVLQRLAGS